MPGPSSIAGIIESSQCWCRASSTGVQSPGPLREPGWKSQPEPAAGLEPARAPLQEGCSTDRAAPASRNRVGSRLRSGTATVTGSHAAPLHHTHRLTRQHPRQESNLICDLRKVACGPAHSEDVIHREPVGDRGIEPRRVLLPRQAARHQPCPRSEPAPRPGVEPGPAPSEGAMMSLSPPGHEEPVDRGGSRTLIR